MPTQQRHIPICQRLLVRQTFVHLQKYTGGSRLRATEECLLDTYTGGATSIRKFSILILSIRILSKPISSMRFVRHVDFPQGNRETQTNTNTFFDGLGSLQGAPLKPPVESLRPPEASPGVPKTIQETNFDFSSFAGALERPMRASKGLPRNLYNQTSFFFVVSRGGSRSLPRTARSHPRPP